MFKHVQTRTQLLITHIFNQYHIEQKYTRAVYLVFREMTFCFIQFGQNDVRANDVSGKRRSAERRFVKMTFGWTTIRKNDVWLNNDSDKCRSVLWSVTNSTIRPCDNSIKWLLANFFSGKTTIRQNCISEKRRFDEMTFRENDVPPNFSSLENWLRIIENWSKCSRTIARRWTKFSRETMSTDCSYMCVALKVRTDR